MSSKSLIWGGMVLGSFVGGFIPMAWNGSVMSYLIWSTIGAVAGVYGGFKFAKASGAL